MYLQLLQKATLSRQMHLDALDFPFAPSCWHTFCMESLHGVVLAKFSCLGHVEVFKVAPLFCFSALLQDTFVPSQQKGPKYAVLSPFCSCRAAFFLLFCCAALLFPPFFIVLFCCVAVSIWLLC